ncbi:ABC-F family ATPase [soil metagenome]
MLSTANITMQFAAKPLFENVSVKFGEGNRYGLIGANGSGKSTFMKILGGDLESSGGNVSLDAHERLGKLRQDQNEYEDQRVIDVVMMGHVEMWQTAAQRDAIYADPDATEDDYMKAAELETRYAEFGGYTAEARAGELLLGVGIPSEFHGGPMSDVAPGLKVRVLLAQALFGDPDILLLDEPTNNLDINTIRWLEGVLNARNSTMIIISHDRHFLNMVCTHMADLDYRELRVYAGNYDDYMLASMQARERLMSANSKAKDRIQELQEFVARFAANKSKARQATSRAKQIDKINAETVEVKPSSRQEPFMQFTQEKKLHRGAFELEGLTHGYAMPLFKNFKMSVEAGEKIAIVGSNGVGKSTLLNIIAGTVKPQHGSLKWAENADVGVMQQDVFPEFESDETLTEWMTRQAKPGDDDQAIRAVLGRLLFGADDIKKKVRVLSGGEKHRMSFGRLLLGRHNVMLLDEPTNHLDMESIEALQMALEKYPGTLVVVSHDRQFVTGVANRIIDIRDDGTIVDFSGSYDDYLQSQGVD